MILAFYYLATFVIVAIIANTLINFNKVKLAKYVVIGGIILMIIMGIFQHSYFQRIVPIYKTIKCSISLLPNQYMNTNTYTFVVNNKEFNTIKDENTGYFKDSESNPYIIVDNVTYKIDKVWYMPTFIVNTVNSESSNYLREVHY